MGQGLCYEKEVADLYIATLKMNCSCRGDIACEYCILNIGSNDDQRCAQSKFIDLFNKISFSHPPKRIEKVVKVVEKTELQTVIDEYKE